MFEAYINILKKAKLFSGIGTEDLEAMMDCLKPKVCEYNKNDYIALAGEKFDSIGIIVKGTAAVTKEDSEGSRVIMTLLKPGDMFGEMVVFSNKPVWPANVFAQENSVVYFIPSAKIVGTCGNACSWHTMLIQNLLKIISEKALMLNKKVEYLTIKSMRGRISAFLLEQYKKTGSTNIILPMNRTELADFLNVSRPSMSREMCKMRDEGIIDFYMETIRILDVDSLKNW